MIPKYTTWLTEAKHLGVCAHSLWKHSICFSILMVMKANHLRGTRHGLRHFRWLCTKIICTECTHCPRYSMKSKLRCSIGQALDQLIFYIHLYTKGCSAIIAEFLKSWVSTTSFRILLARLFPVEYDLFKTSMDRQQEIQHISSFSSHSSFNKEISRYFFFLSFYAIVTTRHN